MKVAARIALALAAAIGAVVWAVLAALAFVHAPWGESRLTRAVEDRASSDLQGTIRIGALRLGALGELDASRVLILDPEGHPAAAIAHAKLRIDPAALLRGTLRVEALHVNGALVEIAPSPEGGLGLSRALRPVFPSAAPEARRDEALPPAPPLPIAIEDLHVDGSFRMAERPGGPPSVLVNDVAIDASAAWRGHRAQVSLTAAGEVAEPIERPIAIGVVADFEDDVLIAEPLDLRLGETRLVAEGSWRIRERIADVALHGSVEADVARRFGVALAQDLRFQGELRQRGVRTEASLDMATEGGGAIRVAGRIDDRSKETEGHAELHGVDPSRWMAGAPKGSIDGDVRATGTLAPMDLHVGLHLEPGMLEGETLGPVEMEGRLRREDGGSPRVEVGRMQARIPGASVEGRGTYAPALVDAHFTLELRDLSELGAWLSRAFGLRLPPLDAAGTIEVDVSGAAQEPFLKVSANLPRVRVADVVGTGVRLSAVVTLSGRAWPAGEAIVQAASARFRKHEVDEITLRAERRQDGAFRIVLDTAQASRSRAGATLRADGIARPGFMKIELRRAALRDGEIDLEGRGSAVHAEGRVTARIETAAGKVGLLRAFYDGPDDPLRARASAPIAVELLAAPVDLGGLSRLLGRPLPAGRIRARLGIGGTLGEPALELDARGTGLWFGGAPSVEPFDVRVMARHRAAPAGHRRGALEAGVDVWSGDRRIAELAMGAPLDVRALRSSPMAELAHMLASPRTEVAGEVRGIDLAALGEAIGRPGLHGAAAVTLDLRGPLRDPRGRIAAELRGGPLGPVRDVRAVAAAQLGDASVKISATVDSEESEEARARASVEIGASLAAILERRVAPSTPVASSIELHRIDLEDLTSDRSEDDGRLAGLVSGGASFSGTVEAPCGEGTFRASGVGARGARFGDLEFSLSLDASRLQARLHAYEEGGGTLVAGVELGERWFEHLATGDAAAIAAVRAKARLEARGLSLAPFGRALSLGYVAGILDATLEADGRLDEIAPLGAISIREGAVQIPGGTMYDRIDARVLLREDSIELRAFDIHGREGGEFFASGVIGEPGARPVRTILAALLPFEDRQAKGSSVPFDLDLRADSLPVSGAGGPLAMITLRDRLQGSIGPDTGVTATLTIASALVELPPKPPRSLQPLGTLPDVVFVPGSLGRETRSSRKARVLPLALHVVAPGDVVITGPNATLEAQADLFVVRESDGSLAANGYARTTSGEVDVAGRTFELEHAELRWTGGTPRNPHIDVTARYEAPQATAWADVGGTVHDPTVHLRSEPPLSESQIVMLVVAGRTQNPGIEPIASDQREGQAGQGAAASLAGAAVTQKLREAIGNRIPVQILTRQSATGQTVVEAGTYLARNLYVGFIRNFLAEPGENTNEVHAQFDLSHTVGLRTRFGDAGAGGVDVVWEKQIATPAQQRARRKAPQPRPPPEPEEETPVENAPPD